MDATNARKFHVPTVKHLLLFHSFSFLLVCSMCLLPSVTDRHMHTCKHTNTRHLAGAGCSNIHGGHHHTYTPPQPGSSDQLQLAQGTNPSQNFPGATWIWLLQSARTSAQDGFTLCNLLVMFFLSSTSANTSPVLVVVITCKKGREWLV